jgi:hypothetical protein
MFTMFQERHGELASLHERQRWAKAVDRLVHEAQRPVGLHPRGLAPIHDPSVLLACEPELHEIREALLDSETPVHSEAIDRLESFVCDGSRSPLMRRDADAARRAALALRYELAPSSPARRAA